MSDESTPEEGAYDEQSWPSSTIRVARLVIGTADNLIRPLLMGESLRLHTVPTFIAMIGGLQLFGASGIVLGPIAFTTTMLLLEFWRRRENR